MVNYCVKNGIKIEIELMQEKWLMAHVTVLVCLHMFKYTLTAIQCARLHGERARRLYK